jgi:hypothetical protein
VNPPSPISVRTRRDITLELVRDAAWRDAKLEIAWEALFVGGLDPPPKLRGLLAEIRGAFPPVDRPRPLGEDCERLTHAFAGHVFG